MKRTFFVLISLIFSISIITSISTAQMTYSTTQITDNDYYDAYPQINTNGDIVWRGSDGSNYQIFLREKTGTIENISNNSYNNMSPMINDDKYVVWEAKVDNGKEEILLYEGQGTPRNISNNPNYEDYKPEINANGDITWFGYDGTDWEIFLYYDGDVRWRTNNSHFDYNSFMNNNRYIVWQVHGYDGADWEIFLYYDGDIRWRTNNSHHDSDPDINNNGHIVWHSGSGPENSDCEILLYEGTGTPINISNNAYPDHKPKINDNGYIAWIGLPSGTSSNAEIFLYEGAGDPVNISNNTFDNRNPEINIDGQVVWQANDGNDWEIFLFDGTDTIQITNNTYDDIYPKINANGVVVWHGYDGNDWEIFRAHTNNPPVLDPIGDKVGYEGELLEFTITASDPDPDDILAFSFSPNGLPPTATFDPQSATFSWTPDYNDAGNYPEVEFCVMDDGDPMELDTELITITIGNVNRPPVFDPVGSQEVIEYDILEFHVSATDPDGDNIASMYAEDLPSGATFDGASGLFSWRPDGTQADVYPVSFYAVDDGEPNETGQIDVMITVGEVTSPTDLTETLIEYILVLELPKQVENSYLANLKKVNTFIELGKITPAINQLEAFILKVEQDVAHGVLSQEDGDFLIMMATDIVNLLTG